MSLAPAPAWRRLRLDFVLLAAAAVAEGCRAARAGAFDAPGGSVSEGRSVSLPSHLLLAPLVAWLGGVLLAVAPAPCDCDRGCPRPARPRFGPLVPGLVSRSLRRRSWTLASRHRRVGLVVAFGTSLRDLHRDLRRREGGRLRFVVGSDLRVTPGVAGAPQLGGLRVAAPLGGVSGVTPVVFRLENSVLIGPYNEDHEDLAAIDPATFGRVARLTGSSFVDGSAAARWPPAAPIRRGILVDQATADDLSVGPGDRVRVVLARGTKRETRANLPRRRACSSASPGFPRPPNLVVDAGRVRDGDELEARDFFLARVRDNSHAGLARAVAARPCRVAAPARDPRDDGDGASTRISRASRLSTSTASSTSTRCSRCS